MIQDQTTKVIYVGNGQTTHFPFKFKYNDKAHIHVAIYDIDTQVQTELTKDFFVDSEKNEVIYPGYQSGQEPPEAQIPPVLQANQKLVIYRQTPLTQEIDFGSKYPLPFVENGTDKNTMISQEMKEALERSVKVDMGSEVKPDELLKDLNLKVYQTTQAAEEGKQALEETKANAEQASINAQSVNIRTFANVEEMKQVSNLKAGALVKTQGFYQSGDGGGADYVIVDNIDENVTDELFIIILQNGLYAKLLIKDYVNIKQLGVKGVEEIDTTETIQKILANNNIKEVYFPEGIYIVKDLININRPIKIRGENAENTIIKAKDFLSYVPGSSIWIILLTNSGAIFENIQLQQNLTDTENRGILLGFRNANGSIFKNCIIYQNTQDFGYVDMYTNNKDITFENCKFKNTIKTKSIKGTGCVMVREGEENKTTNNIYFNNCKFNHESADESIGVWDWFGTVKNVYFNNCTFDDANGTSFSQHFMTLNLKDKSVFLNNCVINRSGENAFSIIKGGYGSTINNCIFNLSVFKLENGFMVGSHNLNNCTIKNTASNLLRFNQTTDTDTPEAKGSFIVNNCSISGFLGFNNGKIINSYISVETAGTNNAVVDGNIELRDCEFNYVTSNSLINDSDENKTIKIINCTIKGILKSSNFITLGENANINIQGAVIDVGNFTIIAPNSTGILDYISYNNAFSNSIDLGEKVINQIKNITE